MKFNATAPVVLFDGTALKAQDNKSDLTLGVALQVAYLSADPAEYKSGEQKYQLYQLARRADKATKSNSGLLELSAEELVLTKKVVAGCYIVAAMGAVYEALESPVVDVQDASAV